MSYTIIGLCIAGGLLAIGILAIVISGIRGLILGTQDWKKIGMLILPFLVFGIAFFMTDNYTEAAIATMILMMGLMALTILATGFRSTFNI